MSWMLKQAFLAGVIAGFVACTRSSEPLDTTPPRFPTFPNLTSPASSSDPCGGPAYTYVSTIQSLLSPTILFNIVPGQYIQGQWVREILYHDLLYTLISRRTDNDTIAWNLTWNGTDSTNQITYDNWNALEGTTSPDGASGDLSFYDPSDPTTQTPFLDAVWRTISSGDLEATMDFFSGGLPNSRIVLISHSDGSGEITEFSWNGSSWVPTGYHAVWAGEGAPAACD